VNLVDEACAEAMNLTSSEVGPEVSEIELAGLHTLPSRTVAPPRIAEAPVALECTEWSTLEMGENRLVVGLIRHVHVRDGILDPRSLLVNPGAFAPVGRMEVPSGYCRTRDRFEMPRPR
jgi:flavin reductase (DIM6/NTAB) family NADH-FMN oxidoreductase RutF